MGQVSNLQVANPSQGTVTRQPQTTQTPAIGPNVPFNRLSRIGQIPGPSQAGVGFGALWTPNMRAAGGYLRFLPIYVTLTGGAGTGAALNADGPYNIIQQILFKDPYGQPVYQADGWSAHLIDMYSGQMGMLGFGNLSSALPSWTAVSVAGNLTYQTYIPFEFDTSGFCSLNLMNAASQPSLTINTNLSTTVFATPPNSTVPTVNLNVRENFWMAPVDYPELAPPSIGSSSQWSVARVQAGVQSAANQRLQLPRVGTAIHTLILTLRDSTGARIDQWPTSDLTLWVDGVPILTELAVDRYDNMYRQFGVARPTGTIVYSFRDSVQSAVSSADTHDNLLMTTPATLLEIGGTFGTISNAPGYIEVITGELWAKGGIPYNHLAN